VLGKGNGDTRFVLNGMHTGTNIALDTSMRRYIT
jgi:hypothetical protein